MHLKSMTEAEGSSALVVWLIAHAHRPALPSGGGIMQKVCVKEGGFERNAHQQQ